MNPRSQATIDIKRNGQIEPVASVLITAKSVRRFMLMQDDYIQLEFSLAAAVHFAIGDFIDDIFGRFVITDEQMPKVSNTTGGYDYTLRFDKDYKAGKQWLHCLIVNGQRMETCWSLTDRLSVHAQMIADNYNISANPTRTTIQDPIEGNRYISTGYAISIGNEARFSEVKFLSYEGVNLIEAMQMIADAWECEWWVTDEETVVDDTTYKHTIHFGKCEDAGDAYDFRLGENVESMDVNRDQQTYANRIFGYGGTQNVPETYDRKLIFTVTTNDVNGFRDNNHPLDNDMVAGESSAVVVPITMNETATQSGNTYTQGSIHITITSNHTLTGHLRVAMRIESDDWDFGMSLPTATARLILHVGNTTQTLDESGELGRVKDESTMDSTAWVWNYAVALNKAMTAQGQTEVYLEVIWTLTNYVGYTFDSPTFDNEMSNIQAVSGEAGGTKSVKVIPYGTSDEYDATYKAENGYISFDSAYPQGWGIGSRYMVKPLNINIPINYYTRDYEVEGMSAVGERRIHLSGNRYREIAGVTAIVEAMVIWENEYPKMNLRIKAGSIWRSTKIDVTKHIDGSVSRENCTQYSFSAEYSDDDDETWKDFEFDTAWIMDGCKLQAAFTSPTTAQQSGYQLGGMTFYVDYNKLQNRFTIIRNEDFGASLPNDYIKPQDHDTFFLVGWNPLAMEELGLITASQNRLESKVNAYLQALQEGQFTFTCHMMSKWGFDLCAHRFYANNESGDANTENDEPFFVNNVSGDGDITNDLEFYVSNGYTEYALLEAGAKVKVWHDALPSGYKESRVIGYEFKLDLPFDTPTYIIGETDAYSRLKKIEKELTKL